jgi:hypothetical protein
MAGRRRRSVLPTRADIELATPLCWATRSRRLPDQLSVNFGLRGGTLTTLQKIDVICYQPLRYVATWNRWVCAACSGVLEGSGQAGRRWLVAGLECTRDESS